MSRLAEIDREIARLHLEMQSLKDEKHYIIEQSRLEHLSKKYGMPFFIGMELSGRGTEFSPRTSCLRAVYHDNATIGDGEKFGWRISGISHDDIAMMRRAWLELNS